MRHGCLVGQLERRQLRVSCRFAQLIPRALAEERDRVAVGGNHLLVLDSRGTECLLHAATRMPRRAPVIAVTHVQRRRFDHDGPSFSSGSPLIAEETAASNRFREEHGPAGAKASYEFTAARRGRRG